LQLAAMYLTREQAEREARGNERIELHEEVGRG
jgi:hypothetical protein